MLLANGAPPGRLSGTAGRSAFPSGTIASRAPPRRIHRDAVPSLRFQPLLFQAESRVTRRQLHRPCARVLTRDHWPWSPACLPRGLAAHVLAGSGVRTRSPVHRGEGGGCSAGEAAVIPGGSGSRRALPLQRYEEAGRVWSRLRGHTEAKERRKLLFSQNPRPIRLVDGSLSRADEECGSLEAGDPRSLAAACTLVNQP